MRIFQRIHLPNGTFWPLMLLLLLPFFQILSVNGQSIIGSQYRQYRETIGQPGQQMFGQNCPNGMPSDGTCAGGYFCINPRETCMSGLCCPRSNDGGTVNVNTNRCPDGSANDGSCFYTGICFTLKEECKSGLCCSRSNDEGTGNTNKCPDGSVNPNRNRGSCRILGVCADLRDECYSGICCTRGSGGRIKCPYGYYAFGGSCLQTGYCPGLQECILGVCFPKMHHDLIILPKQNAINKTNIH